MNIKNGSIITATGICHIALGVSPYAFGKQFSHFLSKYFFHISDGLLEFPLLNGQMNYENFAAFWFFYFGPCIITIGGLVTHVERREGTLPMRFIWTYLTTILLGSFMIPFSGMTILLLPHALYMLIKKLRK